MDTQFEAELQRTEEQVEQLRQTLAGLERKQAAQTRQQRARSWGEGQARLRLSVRLEAEAASHVELHRLVERAEARWRALSGPPLAR